MENNQAVDSLFNLLSKANRDLSMVHTKLHKEFQQLYPDNANPMKLVARLKKIEEEMPSLKAQCRELMAAKQDLIDRARTILVGNKILIRKLQTSTGVHNAEDDYDPTYESFNKVIDEWTDQVRSKTDGVEEASVKDINGLLFSAIVQDD